MLKPFATKLDESILAKLDEISRKTQIPKARLCKQAIELLAEYYHQREADLQHAEHARQHETVSAR